METTVKETTKKFIETYHHIRYCEIVIKPDGEIVKAIPSHIECLIKLLGLPRETIHQLMPISDSPISWLIRKTNCVSVWYDFQLLPYNELTTPHA